MVNNEVDGGSPLIVSVAAGHNQSNSLPLQLEPPSSITLRPGCKGDQDLAVFKSLINGDTGKRSSKQTLAALPALAVLLKEKMVYASAHSEKEKVLLKANFGVIVVGIIFQYVHSVATNVAYYLHTQRPPLYDLGFAFLPALSRKMQILSEILFFILIGATILFAVSPFWKRYQHRPLFFTVILARFLGVCIMAQALRCISFLATSLPGPNYHCRPNSEHYDPPKGLHDIFFRQDAFFGCGDLVFSSHTIFVLLCTLTYTKYGDPAHVWTKRLMWCMVVVFGGLVIAARKHYTLDIVVAMYTVPLLWVAYDHYCPDKIPTQYLEEHDRQIQEEKEALQEELHGHVDASVV